MKNENRSSLTGEQGFTLIELLVTTAIISILSGLSIAAFITYRQSAEYSKGSAALRNARTAINVGDLDLPLGYTLAFTESGATGGNLQGEMAKVMPGANTPEGVRIGVEVTDCTEASAALDREFYLVSQPCRAQQVASWQRFCGGIEILLEHVSNPTPCS